MKKNRYIFRNKLEKQTPYSSLLSYVGYICLDKLCNGVALSDSEKAFIREHVDIYSGLHKYGGWVFDYRSFLDRYFVSVTNSSWYSVYVSDINQIYDSEGCNSFGNYVRAIVKADKLVYGSEQID